MSEAPAVSVLMTVYNGQPYIESALRSIMNQTLGNIEMIVVDDASTDDTPQVLARLSAEDSRIRVETLTTNLKQPGASNRGLEIARAPLIARMDADDIAHPERLEVQKAYLDAHPDVVLVTANTRRISSTGKVLRARSMPLDDFALRWQMRFFNAVIHSSFLFRHETPGREPVRYDTNYPVAQDYKVALQLLQRGKAVCLPDFLVDYRQHATQIMATAEPKKRWLGRNCAESALRATVPEDIADDLMPYFEMRYEDKPPTPDRIARSAQALRRMIRHDVRTRPDLRCWMNRQAAILLVYPLRHRVSRGNAIRLLARHAPDFAIHAGMRLLESRLDHPRVLRCLPDV